LNGCGAVHALSHKKEVTDPGLTPANAIACELNGDIALARAGRCCALFVGFARDSHDIIAAIGGIICGVIRVGIVRIVVAGNDIVIAARSTQNDESNQGPLPHVPLQKGR